jgi:DNA anti-recombination protein RmuC
MNPPHDQPGVAVNDADQAMRPADAAGAGSIDKVRDILFGSHLRDFERRFARLEERLVKETSDLRADVRARLDALETYVRGEAESLSGQIRAEHEGRVDAHDALSRESAEADRTLERRAAALDEQLTRSQRELRHQMLEQHQRLSDEIRSRIDEVLARLSREAQELRSDKTDRAALASLLTEMALRLTDDFHLPEAEEAGNA